MWPQSIEKLHVRGFKAFADASIDLRRFNVLIGPNGAGKSALLSLLRMLRSLSHGQLRVFVGKSGGADDVLCRQAPPIQTLETYLQLQTITGRSQYALVAERTEDDGLLIVREQIERFEFNGDQRGGEINARPSRESRWGERNRRGSEHEIFARFRKFHFANTTSTAPARLECDVDDHHELSEDGGNLAALLYRLQQTHPTAYRRIVGTVRLEFAEFDDFALRPSAINPQRIPLRWRRRGIEEDFGAHQLSDGTLRLILLATLLNQPRELLPPVFAVDEPELGLHPSALHLVTGLLKAASHHSQVLVATQSSGLVDECEPEDIVVISRRDGVSSFCRYDAAQLKEWLEDYSLGELWEKNVVGGGPFG